MRAFENIPSNNHLEPLLAESVSATTPVWMVMRSLDALLWPPTKRAVLAKAGQALEPKALRIDFQLANGERSIPALSCIFRVLE